MNKEKINAQITDICNKIKTNSKDAKYADKLIDMLLSLKGQLDVEPTRLYIPEKDVIKEYDNDNIRIVRCKGYFVWQHKGGMWVVVNPRMRALYEHFDNMLSMKDRYDELSENEKNLYNSLYYGTSLIMQGPLFAIVDDELFIEFIKFIGDCVEKVSKKLQNQPLQEETPIENAEFETKMEVANELLNEDVGRK